MAESSKIINVPNILTILRIPLSVILFILLVNEDKWMSLIVFIVILLTELDGTIARMTGQASKLGFYLDYAIDPVYWACAIIPFLVLGKIPLWFIYVNGIMVGLFLLLVVIKLILRKRVIMNKSNYDKFLFVPMSVLVVLIIIDFKYIYIVYIILTVLAGTWILGRIVDNLKKNVKQMTK